MLKINIRSLIRLLSPSSTFLLHIGFLFVFVFSILIFGIFICFYSVLFPTHSFFLSFSFKCCYRLLLQAFLVSSSVCVCFVFIFGAAPILSHSIQPRSTFFVFVSVFFPLSVFSCAPLWLNSGMWLYFVRLAQFRLRSPSAIIYIVRYHHEYNTKRNLHRKCHNIGVLSIQLTKLTELHRSFYTVNEMDALAARIKYHEPTS